MPTFKEPKTKCSKLVIVVIKLLYIRSGELKRCAKSLYACARFPLTSKSTCTSAVLHECNIFGYLLTIRAPANVWKRKTETAEQ